MSEDIFDFGFTAVTEDELDAVIELQQKADNVLDYHNKLHELYNAVTPLLNSLKSQS